MPLTNQYSAREINAALDEIGGPSHKAPKRIPVGITAPKPKRAYRSYRFEAKYAAKPFTEFDASTARGVKTRLEREFFAEYTHDNIENPEDALIDMIDGNRPAADDEIEMEENSTSDDEIEAAPVSGIRVVLENPEPLARLMIRTVERKVTITPKYDDVARKASSLMRGNIYIMMRYGEFLALARAALTRTEIVRMTKVIVLKDPPLPQDADEKIEALRLSDEIRRENNEAHWRRFQQHATKGARTSRKPIRFARESIRTAA